MHSESLKVTLNISSAFRMTSYKFDIFHVNRYSQNAHACGKDFYCINEILDHNIKRIPSLDKGSNQAQIYCGKQLIQKHVFPYQHDHRTHYITDYKSDIKSKNKTILRGSR